MNLELSSEQIFMRDEARRFLAERASSAAMRRAIEDSAGFDAALWRSVAVELGWPGVAIAEESGGLGLGAVELVLLSEEIGRRLAPIPFWSTACLAVPLIQALCRQETRDMLLTRILEGAAVAVALPDLFALDPMAGISITASPAQSGYRLDGRVSQVADLASADIVLTPARLADGSIALFALTRESYDVRSQPSVDLTRPLGRLILDGVEVPESARMDGGALSPADFDKSLLPAKLFLAAEQVGAAQGCLDLTLAYVAERVQFGRTLASFQVVKHRCAERVVAIAEARALLYGAAASLDAGSREAALEIAALGAIASETLFRVAEESIQLHGGVGNTWEYDPHLYLRRAQASGFMLGSAEDRLAAVADAVLGKTAA